MLGATKQAETRTPLSAPDHAPTLATAPEGLSARRVERWLDLPLGAWQRRRLYALRIKSDVHSKLGPRTGDLVIVEPGASEQPGRIVVTRGASGLSLRRIAPESRPSRTDRRTPTVLELPFGKNTEVSREQISGLVIGLLRPTGTGALRAVPLVSSRLRSRRQPTRRPLPAQSWRSCQTTPSLSPLSDAQTEWREWLAQARDQAHSIADPARPSPRPDVLNRWERLDLSLATLCDCLSRTHSPGLREALAAEASAVVAAIRVEMGR